MKVLGYEYETDYGKKIRIAVICKDDLEYWQTEEKIKAAGFTVIDEFQAVYKAEEIV